MSSKQSSEYSDIAQRIAGLYVNYSNDYIEQFSDGGYYTHLNDGTYLGIGFIEEHLAGNRTFGIREEKAAKVMAFDIDEDNRKAVKGIIAILMELGIPENSIQVSLSGSKGYHVTCFFDRPIELNQLNLFQACVMVKLRDQHPEMATLKVDLRPTPAYGVKIPLGLHRVSGNRCWFLDKDNLEPVKSFEYVYNIEQMSRDYFTDVVTKKIGRENSRNGLAQRAMVNTSVGKSAGKIKPVDAETVEEILSEELLFQHTRHVTLLDMCVRLKSVGVNKTDCADMLKKWMDEQSEDVYTTPLCECMKDIDEIVEYVYVGGANMHSACRKSKRNRNKHENSIGKLYLTHCEVNFILSFPNPKMWPVILFIMKYHKVGLSYSTQWQAHAISTIINECSNGNDVSMQANTVRGYINRLSDIGFIKVNTVKLSEGENPESETGKNNVPQNYYYCRFGNCPTEIAVQPEFAEKMIGDDKVCIVETQNKSYHEILLDAVNFFGMREELFESMSRRSFKNLFGNNKRVA